MKTSAILIRVADFLKRYPPFIWLDETSILEIASSGRVRYHEAGETLYEAGDLRDGKFWVIHKGAVRLTRPVGVGDQTWDLRGTGDTVGAEGMVEAGPFDHTAVIDDESILYQLDLTPFSKACAASRGATRFLAVYFALDAVPEASALHAGHTISLMAQFVRVDPETSVQEVAKAMGAAGVGHAVVIAGDGSPLGIIGTTDLAREIATGNIPVSAPARALMRPPCVMREAEAREPALLMEMIRGATGAICLTQDGSVATPLAGLISERSLLVEWGRHPLPIVRELQRGVASQKTGHLLERFAECARERLRTPDDLVWWQELGDATLRMLLRRALPAGAASVMPVLIGAAGRGEAGPELEVGLSGISTGDGAEEWITKWKAGCEASGLKLYKTEAFDVRDAEGWLRFLQALILDPIGNEVWKHLELFDATALDSEDDQEISRMREIVREALARQPNFVRLLANDSLQNLPPVTIFEGYAVAADGLQLEFLDLDDGGIRAIVDGARVWQLDSGENAASGTCQRLANAARRVPSHAAVLRGGERAFQILHYFRAVHAPVETGVIRPALLSRADQVVLKSAFRGVADLLLTTAHYFGVGSR